MPADKLTLVITGCKNKHFFVIPELCHKSYWNKLHWPGLPPLARSNTVAALYSTFWPQTISHKKHWHFTDLVYFYPYLSYLYIMSHESYVLELLTQCQCVHKGVKCDPVSILYIQLTHWMHVQSTLLCLVMLCLCL